MDINTLYGLAIIVVFVAFVIYVIIKERNSGRMTEALKTIAVEAQKNTRALDLAESLAIKVVPADFVNKVDTGADFLKQFTDDERDTLIDEWRKLIKAAIDGKPNTPATQGVG